MEVFVGSSSGDLEAAGTFEIIRGTVALARHSAARSAYADRADT